MTTNKLANLSGVSQSFLRDIELGNKNPTIETLYYICSALDISLRDFFDLTPSEIHPSLQSALEKYSIDEQIKLADFLNTCKKHDSI